MKWGGGPPAKPVVEGERGSTRGYESPSPVRLSKGAFSFLKWFARAGKRADFAIECN